jgi:hypothetical protein
MRIWGNLKTPISTLTWDQQQFAPWLVGQQLRDLMFEVSWVPLVTSNARKSSRPFVTEMNCARASQLVGAKSGPRDRQIYGTDYSTCSLREITKLNMALRFDYLKKGPSSSEALGL